MSPDPKPTAEQIKERISRSRLLLPLQLFALFLAAVAAVAGNIKTIREALFPAAATPLPAVTTSQLSGRFGTVVFAQPNSTVYANSSATPGSALQPEGPTAGAPGPTSASNPTSATTAQADRRSFASGDSEVEAPHRALLYVSSPTDGDEIALDFKSALNRQLPAMPGSQRVMQLTARFDEDGSKRGDGRIFGSWSFRIASGPNGTTIPGCTVKEPAHWYGPGGLANIDGARSEAIEDGINQLRALLEAPPGTSPPGC